MILYADTSALLKRVVREPESDALAEALAARETAGDLVTASSLAWLEAWRALRRLQVPDVEDVVAQTMSGVAEHELTGAVLERARRLGPDTLRALDAVHLASAIAVNAQSVLTYDDRLAAAAHAVGMSVLTPG